MSLEHQILFLPAGVKGIVKTGTSLLEAARQFGVGVESICGGTGACAKCKCQVMDGTFDDEGRDFSMGTMVTVGSGRAMGIHSNHACVSSRTEHETNLASKNNYKRLERVGCQTKVLNDVVVFIPEESRVREMIVRKAAGKPIKHLDPAVVKYFVHIPAPHLEDQRGDWERLHDSLREDFLSKGTLLQGKEVNLIIDYFALIRLAELAKPFRTKAFDVTVSVWHDREVVRVELGDTTATLLGLAVDLGTTTMATYLCDMRTGETLATESIMNPQIKMGGEDVMNRIMAAEGKENLARMQLAVTSALSELARRVTQSMGYTVEDIAEVVLVANTCMHHIFLGLDPESLGKSPFNPRISGSVNIKARDLGVEILPSVYIHLLPNQAGFVGADNTAVAISLEPYNSDEVVAIIDIGTNGEILVGNRTKIYSTSCPTGPALEGASIKYGVRAARGAIEKIRVDPLTLDVRYKVIGKEAWNTRLPSAEIGAIGICGSAIIDICGELYKAGIIAGNGKMNMDRESPRLRRLPNGTPEFVIAWAADTAIGEDITVTLDDVRNIQLAKAAVYSGIQVLMEKFGAKKLDRVILAGAFGSHIDIRRSLMIGLFQDVGFGNVASVGNAAGDGARLALMDKAKRIEADRVAREIHYVELTNEPSFIAAFVDATHFPHKRHAFHSLARYGIDPLPPAEIKKERSSRRSRRLTAEAEAAAGENGTTLTAAS